MSRKQYPDDPALGMREVWLGPANSWRWPFDATYSEWKVAAAVSLVAGLALWLFLPFIVPVAALGWLLARYIGTHVFPEKPWGRRGVLIAYFAMLGLFVPSLHFWLAPLPLLLALLVAPLCGIVTTWRFGKWITKERPLRYWLSLPLRVARGPRVPTPHTYDVSTLALKTED